MIKRSWEEKDREEEGPLLPSKWTLGDLEDPEELLRRFPDLKDELKRLFRNVSDKLFHGEERARILERTVAAADIPEILGDFKILREIGSGGMATIYEAEQISLKRRVALKVLPSYMSFSSRAVGKFRREAEAGSRQIHPGIVQTHAMGNHGKIHYIAEEFVEGGRTLADWLEERKKEKKVSREYFRKVALLFAEIADALNHAHASGVVHRDVKPSNVLITKEFKPKITDFGLASVEGAPILSATGDFIGTLYYMSPEQAEGSRSAVDHRTDIYSLGVTLYECITLVHPFETKTRELTLQKILQSEPRDPGQISKRVPKDLATICMKAMQKNPADRYGTMGDFAEDLRRYLKGEAIMARSAGSAQRMWRRLKRNPVLVALSVLAVLSVSVLLLYVLWSYPKILAERDKALQAREEAEREARKANSLSRFLQDMFAAPNPGVEKRNIKVADVLDRAARDAGLALSGQPEVEAALRRTL